MSSSASTSMRQSSVGRNGAAGGSHHRDDIVVASPTRTRFDIELPLPRMPNVNPDAGATPIFELRQDPLESARTTPRPHDHAKSINDVVSTPKAKRKIRNEGTKLPTSSSVARTSPSSSRLPHSTIADERRSSVPAFGPTRQSSMGKAAASQYTHDAVSGRSTPQMAAYMGSRPESANSISRRHVISPETVLDRQHSQSPTFEDEETDDEQDKGHGARRQSSIPTSGRWTPTILSGMIKKTASPVYTFNQSPSKQVSVQAKYAYTEQYHGPTDAEMQYTKSQGRKTPAKYQPQQDTSGAALPSVTLNQGYDYYPPPAGSISQSYRASHPLAHAHKVSSSTTGSNSSHSIQMHDSQSRHASISATSPRLSTGHASMHVLPHPSPVVGNSTHSTANSSPLVIPHARRGAINLRPAGRRKKAALARRRAALLAAKSSKVPPSQQLQRILSGLIKALRCPSATAHAFVSYLQDTLQSIDTSFRCPRTGKRVWKPSWIGAYIPLLIWLVVSLTSTFTVLIWHTEVFQALDRLSTHLQEMGLAGRLFLGSLIFLTTFPPLPLYSTLIILCGFSFGLVQGFIISYVAALSGAIVVFLLSRSLLKNWMVELLNKSGGMKRVVRAIEKRPKLLFLVRLAPYPYNLMNTLLASSPTLTLRTYTLCTALALPKLLVHCALGTSIKNFAAYNGAAASSPPAPSPLGNSDSNDDRPPMIGYDPSTDASSSGNAEAIKHVFGFVGVGLCVGIFIYLFSVARKAVDEELDDEDDMDEYGVVLSDEESEGEEEEDEESSELDRDELSIARLSNESSKETSMLSRRTSLPASTNIQCTQVTARNMINCGSDSTLVNGLARPYTQAGETVLFSTDNHKIGGSDLCDGSARRYADLGPYSHPQGNGNRSHRNLDSQVSLADSIVEMEKHAMEMEQEPLFQNEYSYNAHMRYQDDDSCTEKEPGTLRRK